MTRVSRTAGAIVLAGLALAACGKKSATTAATTTAPTTAAATTTSAGATTALPSSSPTQLAVPSPGDKGTFGDTTLVAVPKAGAPVVAYVWEDTTGDGDSSKGDDQLLVTSFDPVKKAYRTPTVLTTGAALTGRFGTNIAIGADVASGTVAVAWVDDSNGDGSTGLKVAVSADSGVSFAAPVSITSAGALKPSVGVGAGRLTVAFQGGGDGAGVQIATASVGAAPTFTVADAPALGADKPAAMQPAVATDAGGAAYVAYHLSPDTGYNRQLVVLKAGSTTPVKVLDSGGNQADDASAALAFKGSTMIAASSVSAAKVGGDYPIATYATSSDGGRTFASPLPIPAVGASGPFTLSLAPGKAETVLAFVANGGNGNGGCGSPALAGSTDLTSWTTCDPFGGVDESAKILDYPGAAAGPDGTVYVAFANTATDAKVPAGILVWSDGGTAAVKKTATP